LATILTCKYCGCKSSDVRSIVLGDRAEIICTKCLEQITEGRIRSMDRESRRESHPYVHDLQEMRAAISNSEGVIPLVDLGDFDIDPESIVIIPETICREYVLIPLGRIDDTLYIVLANEGDAGSVRNHIKYLTGYDIEIAVGEEEKIVSVIDEVFS